MKTIGVLGGMSWQSTQVYYQLLNEGVSARLGGLHSAKIILYSVDFDHIERLQHAGEWAELGRLLRDYAQRLEAAGAEGVIIATNTMHKVAPMVTPHLNIPLLHIADCTGEVLLEKKVRCVGLLGTLFTMEDTFYSDRIREKYGIDVLVPQASDRQLVHDVIYGELCLGTLSPQSRQRFLAIIDSLAASGAEAVILGCTEIGLLVKQTDTAVPLLDTTEIHALAAVDWALKT